MTTTTGRVDGAALASCTVGGLDATDAILDLWASLDREDIRYVFVSGVAPAWYNLLDMSRLAETIPVPMLVLSYEASEGLESAIREAFDGHELARRLERYRALPDRSTVALEDRTIYVRNVDRTVLGLSAILGTYTVEGGRPEPVRVARFFARAGDSWDRSR